MESSALCCAHRKHIINKLPKIKGGSLYSIYSLPPKQTEPLFFCLQVNYLHSCLILIWNVNAHNLTKDKMILLFTITNVPFTYKNRNGKQYFHWSYPSYLLLILSIKLSCKRAFFVCIFHYMSFCNGGPQPPSLLGTQYFHWISFVIFIQCNCHDSEHPL